MEGVEDENGLFNLRLNAEFVTPEGKFKVVDINTCFEKRYSPEHNIPWIDIKYIVEKIL